MLVPIIALIIIFSICGALIIVFGEKNRNTYPTCPVCGKSLTNNYAGHVLFNDQNLCKHCSKALDESQYIRIGSSEKYDLDMVKEIVENYYNKDNYNYDFYDDNSKFDFELARKLTELDKEYANVLNNHFAWIEKTGELYSTAINLPDIHNNTTYKCIELCKKDIAIAKDYKLYNEKRNELLNDYSELPSYYPSYYYLIQLYVKLGDIDKAIYRCKEAIDLGYTRDNSKGGMVARLVRLIKKSKKNWEYDVDNNTLYDRDTGEVL